jgi:hypothetical protein
MVRWIVCLLAAAALTVAANSAEAAKNSRPKPSPEVIFRKRDKNGDGVLTVQEFVGKRTGGKALKAAKIFQRKDRNGDGVLTFAEFMTSVKKKR